MVHDWIEGTFRQTNLPNESPEYLAKREEVRLADYRNNTIQNHVNPVNPVLDH